MKPIIAVIWGFTLLGTLFLFVPNAVSWLIRALAAARHIERYTEEILAAGAGIAENTSKVAALEDTLSVAPQLVTGAQSINSHVAALESVLTGRGHRAGRGEREG